MTKSEQLFNIYFIKGIIIFDVDLILWNRKLKINISFQESYEIIFQHQYIPRKFPIYLG